MQVFYDERLNEPIRRLMVFMGVSRTPISARGRLLTIVSDELGSALPRSVSMHSILDDARISASSTVSHFIERLTASYPC